MPKRIAIVLLSILILGALVNLTAGDSELSSQTTVEISGSSASSVNFVALSSSSANSVELLKEPHRSKTIDVRDNGTPGGSLHEEEILVKYELTSSECRSEDVTEDGVTKAKQMCKTSLTFDHPYNEFSYEQLLQIHEADAMASYILGMRTFHDHEWRQYLDYEESVNHLHRAAILSGKAQPFLDMLRSRGLDNPKLPRTELGRRESYVWYEAGIRAGVIQQVDRPLWMTSLNSTLSPTQLAEWDEVANSYAEQLWIQRSNVTGESF